MYLVIMAGGSGTRFWPVSRRAHPKQLLRIVGDEPLVRATYERVRELADDDHVLLVVGEEHLAETERLFSDVGVTILGEPLGRNTAPCIGLAAKWVEARGGAEPLAILPADHYIADVGEFRRALRQAAHQAEEGGIVTLGIVPTRPETGYGYIECDRGAFEDASAPVYRVRRFVEKPALAAARQYLVSGDFLWNAGIFVATAATLLEAFARHLPVFSRGLERLAGSFGSATFAAELRRLYEETESISFDYAVMERTTAPCFVIPCRCGWSDVGSWSSLHEVRAADEDAAGNVVEGEVLLLDCERSLVLARGRRLVATLGLRRVLVVDTEDSVLVADLERSQDIRRIISALEAQGRKDLL
jgi:mannose-1-phosphate guanylyltransferase